MAKKLEKKSEKKKIDPKVEKAFRDLRNAVSANDEAAVKIAVAAVDPDALPYNAKGDSALGFAVGFNRPLSMIKLLVDHGARLDFKNEDGETPVDAAVKHERQDVIAYFASKGAKVKFVAFEDLPQKEKNARLASILDDWYQETCAKRLAAALTGGADANAKVDGTTPLHRIAGQGDVKKLFELLLEAGADPKVPDDEGDTAMHVVATHGDIAPVTLFLDGGVPIDIRDAAGNTPLHRAAGGGYNGADKVVKLLLDRGADPMLRNKAGETAIAVADDDSKKLMLKRIGKPLSKPTSALLAAVAADDIDKVVRLLGEGAEPSAVDMTSGKSWGASNLDGVAAIHIALARGVGRPVVEAVLAAKNLDVNVKSVDGRTPLHVVLQYGKGADRAEFVARLLALGADVNARGGRGETPIFEVPSFYELDGELELIDTLVAAGAKLDALDGTGLSMLDRMLERTQRFHEVNDKPGFVAIMTRLVELKVPTNNAKAVKAWLADKGKKYAPKKAKV